MIFGVGFHYAISLERKYIQRYRFVTFDMARDFYFDLTVGIHNAFAFD